MIDFKNFEIKRGPTEVLHNPKLLVEEGCWYLSTDTAELFIGLLVDGIPQLKPVNGTLIETSLATYATQDFVREAIASLDIPEINISDFATKEDLNKKADISYVDEKVASIVIPEINLDGVATEDWVQSQNYLTEHIDISGKQDVVEDLEEIRDGAALGKTALQEIPAEYAKKDDLFNKDYNELINKPEGLATESFVLEKIAEAEIGEKEIDLSAYAKKEDLFSKDYNDLENKPVIPEAYDDTELKNLIDGKAASDHTHEEYLTSQSLDGYAKTADLFSKDYNDLTNKPELFSGSYNDLSDKPELFNGDYNKLTNKPELPSFEDFATEAFVTEEINKIELPEAYDDSELRNLINSKADSVHSHEEYSLAEHTHDEYLTELPEHTHSYNDLTNKPELFNGDYNNLTNKPEIPDAYNDAELRELLSQKATKDEIPTKVSELENDSKYITEDYVDNAIANIEHPVNPTKVSELENDANYTDETRVLELIAGSSVATGATIGIDFTTNITVGHLAAGTAIPSNMTISNLLYKILFKEQTENPDTPVEPDLPETPEEIIESIIENNTPMYSINNDGELVAEEFEIIEVTQNENGTEASPTESGFYELTKANGEVEHGYQDLQIINDEMYYVIALPKSIDYYSDNIKLQAYDEEDQVWNDCIKMDLTCDEAIVNALCEEAGIDIATIRNNIGETHTIWALEESCTGSKLRYVIVE